MKKRTPLTEKKNVSSLKWDQFFRLFSLTTIMMLVAVFTWQCKNDDFTGETFGVCPEVISTNPENGAISVVTNKLITATFNEKMNAATINTTTYLVRQGTNLVSGSVVYSAADSTATFIPTNLLEANTVYTATITREVKDPDGNQPIADYTWSFNTGTTPIVTLTSPVNGAVDVALGNIIAVDFSTEMDPLTINSNTFIVKQGTTIVPGGVSYVKAESTTSVAGKVSTAGLRATFTPTGGFAANKVYEITITKAVKDIAGNAMSKDTTWSFATSILPIVALADPLDGAVNVALDKKIRVTFSKAMNAATISSATFTIKKGTTPVLGIVTYTGMTATFTPTTDLTPDTEYTGTITTGAKDVAGNSMISNYVWKFTTGSLSNVNRPSVISTDPTNGALNVPLNKIIKADFSKSMNQASISSSTFTLKEGTNLIPGLVSYSGVTAVFTPSSPLTSNKSYTATITTGAKDLDGNSLANNYVWSFSTGVSIQLLVELSSNPIAGGISTGGGLFNTGASVTVIATANTGYSFLNWTEDGESVSPFKNYTFVITDNRTLVANYTAITEGPGAINLGSAGNFSVLGGSGVSNTGVSTKIIGDVGSFPTGTINGLLSGNVTGKLYTTADPIVGIAINDLTAAYNEAQAKSVNAISLPGQLGGLTLAPGLYVNSSTSGISGTGANGILTLDAGGNPNAFWVFKMGSTFITDSGTSVVLAGGAQAKNIYWSIGTSATLGTNSIFYGNILADQSITLTTGATLTGRALTRIGAVTLDSNIVTKP